MTRLDIGSASSDTSFTYCAGENVGNPPHFPNLQTRRLHWGWQKICRSAHCILHVKVKRFDVSRTGRSQKFVIIHLLITEENLGVRCLVVQSPWCCEAVTVAQSSWKIIPFSRFLEYFRHRKMFWAQGTEEVDTFFLLSPFWGNW
jgi:hypothetical protein